MSLYQLQKLIYHVNRDPSHRERYRQDPAGFVKGYELSPEEETAVVRVDVRKLTKTLHSRGSFPAASTVHFAAQSFQLGLRQSSGWIGVNYAYRFRLRCEPCSWHDRVD
jgi:Aromatic-ring-opening dioxygenase LigAB, LigA subunit